MSRCKKLIEKFAPNVAGGSTFALEVKPIGSAKVSIKQDNGQEVIVHHDDIDDLIKILKKLAK